MTAEKIIEALALHGRQLEERFTLVGGGDVSPKRNPEATQGAEQIRHLKWMVGEASGFAREGRLDKAQRWLGFVQGALWMVGLSTIEESKRANMPDGAAYEP